MTNTADNQIKTQIIRDRTRVHHAWRRLDINCTTPFVHWDSL